MVKKIVEIGLLLFSCFMGYLIYNSITGPIKFEKQKQIRYAAVIDKIKQIRNAQDACFSATGKYAEDFASLEKFVETGNFYITTQRDTSWVQRNKQYNIDELKQSVIVDTIGKVRVIDSLFKNSNAYKTMKFLPKFDGDKVVGDSDKTFEMSTKILDKGNYQSPVYEVKTLKKIILEGLDEDEIEKEIARNGVNDVKGAYVKVGSLTEVSNSGNWPTIYDAKTNKK